MKVKILVIVITILSHTSCKTEETGVVRRVGSLTSQDESKHLSVAAPVLDGDYIQRLISALSEENNDERLKAQTEILRLAEESPVNRETIIRHLIRSVEDLKLEGKLVLEPPAFKFWSSATQIFSRLKATESIDLLIRFIYCGDGLSSGASHHHPAEGALVDMGNLAVPKLSEALLNNRNPVIKKSVAKCLGNIGGPEAKRSLEYALQSEGDEDVSHTIKLALAAVAREPVKL